MKTLKEIYIEQLNDNAIDPSLYAKYQVKQGLRNENGTGVKVGLTKICDVVGYAIKDGEKINVEGQLIYRGYSINDLITQIHSKKSNGFEMVAFLLVFGKLPSHDEQEVFHQQLMECHHMKSLDAHYATNNILNALQIEVLKMYGLDENPDSDTLDERMSKGIQIFSSIPLFVFSSYYKKKITSYPLSKRSFSENILCLARNSQKYTLKEAKMMDVLLMLHADHGGGNNSTFANVVISSTGTDIYSCIAAAIGSLKGPRHGGANVKVVYQFEEIIKTIGITTDMEILNSIARKILEKDFFDQSGLIYGIGHAIYSKSDPRAKIIKEYAKKLAIEKGKYDVFSCLEAFEQAAITQMRQIKGIETCANVDYYSGFAYTLLGIDPSLFTPLFTISRTIGWIAHHLENRQNNRKLIRPANVYVGELRRKESR